MMIKVHLSILFLSFIMIACQQTTSTGFEYTIHIDKGQPPAQIGDQVYVYFQIRTVDTLLLESPQQTGYPTILRDRSDEESDPIADILPLLGEGDSATVKMPITDEMRMVPALMLAKEMLYEVVVRKIVRAEDLADNQDVPPVVDDYSSPQEEGERPDFNTKLMSTVQGKVGFTLLTDFIAAVETGASSIQETSSGLKYRILDKGDGPKLMPDDKIELRYLGGLADGTIFAESITNDLPFTFVFQNGRVIKGWDEGVDLVRGGGKILLAIPPGLAYGAVGKEPFIGPNTSLYYYLEVN